MASLSNDWTGQALAGGRYLITAKLGEGGMGAVYRAQDRNIGADVVIKVPLRKMLDDPEFSGRFKDEIRSLVLLSHPHIVKVTDVGECEGLPFAVMQFLPGGSLEERRQAEPAEVPRWLTAIAEALDYVHTQGYVHRDVKPGNILFDNQGHAFLGDFGVVKVLASATDAKSARTAMTGAGMLIGTPEYMAPELIMGEPFDGRVDQYALAVTAYEMLSGRRPFEDEIKTKVLVLQTTQAPLALAEFCTWVAPEVSQAVLKGLAKDPKQRHASCAAFAAAVRAAVEANPEAAAEKVRLRCPACGRKLGLAPHDFVRRSQSGRPVSCPACQAKIHLTNDLVVRSEAKTPGQGSVSGSTIAMPTLHATDDDPTVALGQPRRTLAEPGPATPTIAEPSGLPGAAAWRANPTVVEPSGLPGAAARRNDTVVEPSGLADAPRRANATVVEPSGLPGAAARRNATVVEPSGLPGAPRRAAATVIERTEPRDAQPPPPLDPAGRSGLAPVIWISAAVTGAVLVIGLVTATVMMRAMGPGAAPPVATVSPALTHGPGEPTLPPAASDPNDLRRPGSGGSGPVPVPQPVRNPGTGKPRIKNGRPASGPRPGQGPSPGSNPPPSSGDNAPDPAATGPPGIPVASTDRLFNPPPSVPIAPKPPEPEETPETVESTVPTRRVSVPVEKILADPGLYANQVVALSQSYCISDVATRRPDGSIGLPVIESNLDYVQANDTCVVRRRKSLSLDLDPRLAKQLALMKRIRLMSGPPPSSPVWDNSPAILTVRIASRGSSAPDEWACRIVKFEFFNKFDTQVVAAGYKKKLKVIFHTQSVTGQSAESGVGNSEEWSNLNRLGHLANQFQKLFDKLSYMESQSRWNRINSVISSTIQRGTSQAAANNAADEAARIKAMTGGR
jgi:serine/threonine-protein kinase